MVDAIAWPIAAVMMSAFAGYCALSWIVLRSEAQKTQTERDHRDNGVVVSLKARCEEVEEQVRQMRNEQKAFLANARR